jgi:YidC/Oxa1 family membrane protein insertase
MGAFFTAVLFQPFLNLLVFFYNLPLHDMGLAIILLTVLVRGALWPLTHKSLHTQRAMLEIQPKLNALKEQFKDDKEKQGKAMMDLYKNEKVSPFSSCLPLLLQLPIFIGLYKALNASLASKSLDLLYPFVHNPGKISTLAFGFLDLSKHAAGPTLPQTYWPALVITILAAVAQFFQAKMMQLRAPKPKLDGSKDEDMTAMMNKQMLYMMPAMTLFIGWNLPTGLTFYWLLTTVFMIIQQAVFMHGHKHRLQGVDKV